VKRWEIHPLRGYQAVVSVAALGLLAPAVVHAAATPGANSIPGYTLSVPLKSGVVSGLDISDANLLQMGNANNKGQFCMNFVSSNQGGEREYLWDGTKLIKVADDAKPLPDGAIMGGGNTWSPTGLNNNGVVGWVVDPSDKSTGPHYVVAFDSVANTYTIVARPGDPAPGGGTYEDGPATVSRMIADINDLNQVAFENGRPGADGMDHAAVYMYDLKAKKGTLLAGPDVKTSDGKTLTDAGWPSINNNSEVVFTGSLDGNAAGIYQADAKGTVTAIIPAGSTIDGQKIGSARWARNNNRGDVVAVVDLNGSDNGLSGEPADDTGVAIYSAADKSVHLILKPGDKVPGGTYHGVEHSRRTVGITDSGQVFFLGVLESAAPDGTQNDGVYRWDPDTNTIDALVLGETTVTGLGKVAGVTQGNGGVSGYHMGVSGDGHVAFPAVVDGAEGYVLATPPKQ
jgi:hypothetical protein